MATKKTTTEAVKPSTNGKAKDGLRKPQVRVLEILRKAGKPMLRSELKEKAAGVDFSVYVGCQDDAARAASDEKHGLKSLITLKFVLFRETGDGREAPKETVYDISGSGKKALEKAVKAAVAAK